ncbi:DUF2238 domain-containing protein [Dysgonomonas reticulitermitis]
MEKKYCFFLTIFFAVAIWSGDGAEDFLGMQGYEWDTQSDMFCAMTGAICMLVFFSKLQNKQINQISKK